MKSVAELGINKAITKVESNNRDDLSVEMTSKRIAPMKLRDRYLLERQAIQAELGSLDDILALLGISQRRACQLLLVDPSAWTRWNKSEAPPHVYQALKWLIHLKTLNPAVIGPTDIAKRLDLVQQASRDKIRSIESHISALEKVVSTVVVPDLSTQEKYFETALENQKNYFLNVINKLEAKIEKLIELSANKKRKKSNSERPVLKSKIRSKTKRNDFRKKNAKSGSKLKLKKLKAKRKSKLRR